MYCTQCGIELRDTDRYCFSCGKATGQAPQAGAARPRLERVWEDKKVAGVCAGFARYLDIDVALIRIAWLLLALFTGVGFIAYVVAWIAMPKQQPPAALPAAATG